MLSVVFYHVCYSNNEIVINNECVHATWQDSHHCNGKHMCTHLTQHDEHGITMIMSVDDVTTQSEQCALICNITTRWQHSNAMSWQCYITL